MERSVIIAGFGGQGVILAGKILAQAGMDHGLEVTWLPSYGPEMRGGTANCTVVMSETTVGSPIVDEPDNVIAMNLPSLDKFEPIIAKGGAVLVNASLIERKTQREDIEASYVQMNDIAIELGNKRAINMIALGAYVKQSGIIPLKTVVGAMSRMMEQGGKAKFIPMNEQALESGYNAAG